MLRYKKIFSGICLLTMLITGCNRMNNGTSHFSTSVNNNSATVTSTTTTTTKPSSSVVSSVTKPQQVSTSTEEKVKPTRPHTTHKFGEWEIIVKADLFNPGEKYHKCEGCPVSETVKYYDLSEVTFKDKVYQYDGTKRTLTIDGLLPKGITVAYTNNTLRDIGSVVSYVNFLDEDSNIVETRSAVLTIIPYRGLPEVKVTTAGGEGINSKAVYTNATFEVSNCDTQHKFEGVSGGIRLRGNGTLEAPKKAYRIKFEKKQSILGLNDGAKIKSWVLLAEYYDYSMMRNGLAYSIGDAIMNGRGYYSSDYTHVNLYINGVYNGIYVLAEQTQANENRIDIYEPEPTENTTNIGYLLELDSYGKGEGHYFVINDPSYEVLVDLNGRKEVFPEKIYSIKSDYFFPEQKEFISKYISNVFKIMYEAVAKGKFLTLDENYNIVSSNYTSVYQTLNAVIDVDSLVRSYILEEFMKDIDVGFSSYYMFVDFSENSKFKRLTFGAPWDFDWSSGNVTGAHLHKTDGEYNSTWIGGHINPWLFLLSKTDFFYKSVHDIWTLMDECNVINNIIDRINYTTTVFKNDFDKNFMKWNDLLGQGHHTYHSSDVWNMKTHRDAIDCLLKWMNGRKAYLDSKWL